MHRLLELVDLRRPEPPDVEQVRGWYPAVTDEELERIAGFVASYCGSELAQRIAGARRARGRSARSRSSTTACCCTGGSTCSTGTARARSSSTTRRTRSPRGSPEEIVEADYRLQRLVYALACFRAGAEEVEVVYHFLERPDAVVTRTFARAEVPELEAELSDAIARIRAGEFRPTPSEFTCAGCPVLDVVCAGPRLRSRPPELGGRLVMKVAVLCDVHGNLPALEAVLADERFAQADRVVVGGDLVGGPLPAECLDALLALGDRVDFVRGNADRFVVDGSSEYGAPWVAEQLGPDRLALVAEWPLSVELDVDGLGRVLFCHATPWSDEEILTRITPDEQVAEVLGGVEAGTVVGGHTHVQFDRRVPGAPRFVNAGSVGMPYEGRRGAFWALLGPDVELLRTEYDVEAAAATIAGDGLPDRGGAGPAAGRAARPRRGDGALRVVPWRVASSARRAGLSAAGAIASGRSSSGSRRSTRTRASRSAIAATSSCSSP